MARHRGWHSRGFSFGCDVSARASTIRAYDLRFSCYIRGVLGNGNKDRVPVVLASYCVSKYSKSPAVKWWCIRGWYVYAGVRCKGVRRAKVSVAVCFAKSGMEAV